MMLNTSTAICRKKETTRVKKTIFSRSVFSALLIMLVFASGILYVSQVNKIATMGYEIKQEERKLVELQKQKKQMELEAAQLKSIYNLEGDKELLDMHKPEDVQVIEVEFEKPVAMKR